MRSRPAVAAGGNSPRRFAPWPSRRSGPAKGKVAEEIGAHKSLVAVWVKNAQREDPAPAFIEVAPPTEVKPGRKQGMMVVATDAAPICRISIGNADIAIPPGYPADHLAEVLRALRDSQ